MNTVEQAAPLTVPGQNGAASPVVRETGVLRPWLRAQALNLSRHTEALRPFQRDEFGSGPESPTEGHIQAVNQLMGSLRKKLDTHARELGRLTIAALRNPTSAMLQQAITHKHMSHNHVQAIETIWDFYFELFGQRQSQYGCWLLSCDRIALDCYQDAYVGLGQAKSIPAPPPFCYMRTGFGPATYRRAIPLRRLGQQLNPFPLVQLPYHRLVNPWTLGAVLHEVSHNLQSDLGLSRAVPRNIARRLLKEKFPLSIVKVWTRWNRETFADMSGLLLGGPCVVASLMDVVGRSPEVVYHFSPGAVHPTPYLRTLLSVELLRRMGFVAESEQFHRAWTRMYPNPSASNIPPGLLRTASKAIPLVVDAICYQPYEELGGKPLSKVICFAQKEQRMIEECAQRLAAGTDPGIVPERFLIGAARVALDQRLAKAETIKVNFYNELSRR